MTDLLEDWIDFSLLFENHEDPEIEKTLERVLEKAVFLEKEYRGNIIQLSFTVEHSI